MASSRLALLLAVASCLFGLALAGNRTTATVTLVVKFKHSPNVTGSVTTRVTFAQDFQQGFAEAVRLAGCLNASQIA